MIKIKDIHISFDGNEILKGIDLNIQKGEVIGIIGPSGSGKSTFLRSINHLETPEKGIIEIDDKIYDLEKMDKRKILELRKYFTMVFQNYNLFKHRTVIENIIEGLIVVKKIKKDEAMKIGLKYLEKVGLLEKADFYPSQLSGGQQQRIGIARALAMESKVILFDEPTSALDPELVGEVLTVIKNLAKEGVTMIIVTHEIQFAKEISDFILFMEDGKIIKSGKTQEFFNDKNDERLNNFLRRFN
nr:amino acid ABC transporter ATP-binding protein [uncultured Leptotrichia sp.]